MSSATFRLSSWLLRLLRLEPLVVLLAAPFYLFPSAGGAVLLGVIPGLWLVRLAVTKQAVRRSPLDWTVALLLLMLLASLYASFDIGLSVAKIAGVVLGVGVYYMYVGWVGGRSNPGWGLLAFMVVGTGVAAVGLVGGQWGEKIDLFGPVVANAPVGWLRLPGAENGIQPNEIAGALLWVLPFSLAFCSWLAINLRTVIAYIGSRSSAFLAVTNVGVCLLLLGTLALTQSRSGYIGLILGLAGVILFVLPPTKRLAGLGLVGGLAVVALLAIGQSLDQAATLLTGRAEIWQRALFGLQDFPVTGFGLNMFRSVVPRLYPLSPIGPDPDIGHAHNELLQAGLDLGLPGLMAFVALNVGGLAMLQRIGTQGRIRIDLKRNRHIFIDSRYLIIGLGGGLLAHWIYGLTDAVALGAKPGFLFWMLLGLIGGLYQRATEHPPAA
jgi:putative inorganic carbon (HCO3(-)) transporter